MRHLLPILIAAIVLVITPGRPSSPDIAIAGTGHGKPLIVLDNYPPYHFWEGDTPAGLNIDVLNEVFARLGITPDYQRHPWKRSLKELAEGDITGLCAAFKTPDREKIAWVPSRELSAETNWIISIKDKDIRVSRLEDLTTLTVGTVTGYSYGEEFDKLKVVKRDRSATDSQLLEKLIEGRVDVIVGNDLVIRYLASHRRDQTRLKFHFKLNTEPTYLLLSKAVEGNQALSNAVSGALQSMREDGTYKRIIRRYQDLAPMDIFAVTTELWPPFRLRDDKGYLTGIDKEILDEVGRRMGIRFTWHQRPWVRCLLEIQEGKADIITGVVKPPQRETFILYSDRYYFVSSPAFYLAEADRAKSIRSYRDLKRLSIGYSRGSAYFKRFDEDHTLDKRGGTNERQLIRMVLEGRWDAFIGTDSQVEYDLNRLGLAKRIFKAAYAPQQPVRLYLGISKRSSLTKRLPELNKILDALVREGFVRGVSQKYLGK